MENAGFIAVAGMKFPHRAAQQRLNGGEMRNFGTSARANDSSSYWLECESGLAWFISKA
jgi:hypothetical protein